jgi:GNAT superfamily N-acetyltransferase
MALTIHPMNSSEIPLIKDFAPKEWNTNLSELFGSFFDQPFFYPILAECDGTPVGCANGLWNGNAGWLGNIIVLPDYRGQGIGSALTGHLVSHFQQRNCRSQILIATLLGEPIYRKAGFITQSTYSFLRRTEPIELRSTQNIREAGTTDFDAIDALDQEASGEARRPFLEQFMTGGWVHQRVGQKEIGGYFLPKLRNGLIVARNAEVGLELLNYKLSLGSTFVVVPSENRITLEHLIAAGFQVQSTAPRMVLGPEVAWHPEMVFSRGSGYCG